MIHVCYGLYDKVGRYSKFTGTAMLSLFENTTAEVTVHILHDNTLTMENRENFVYIAGQYNQKVKFYNVARTCAAKIKKIGDAFSKANYFDKFSMAATYRLMMPDVLPDEVDKVIYLDSDIIVNLDIREFWAIELDDKPLATVAEIDIGMDHSRWTDHAILASKILDYKKYFCDGVMMISLSYLRQNNDLIDKGIDFVINNTNCNYFDQDALNYLFSENYINIPEKFDCFVHLERLRRSTLRPAIYHYAVQSLTLDMRDNFNRLFMKYFSKTPWFNEDVIGRLYSGVQQLYINQKKFAVQLTSIMKDKSRAFFLSPKNVEPVKKIFGITKDEEIIVADSSESLQKVADSLKRSNGRKIFFVLVPRYILIRQALLKVGFVENKDFINATLFLSDANGVPFNSHSLVKII